MASYTSRHQVPFVESKDRLTAYPALSRTLAAKVEGAIDAAQSSARTAEQLKNKFENSGAILKRLDSGQALGGQIDIDAVKEPGIYWSREAGVSKQLSNPVAYWMLTVISQPGAGFVVQILDGIDFDTNKNALGAPKLRRRFSPEGESKPAAPLTEKWTEY